MTRIFIAGVIVFVVTFGLLVIDIVTGLSSYFATDLFEHFFGGVLAGLIGMWWALALTKRATLTHALVGACILGLLVEIVEYAFGWGISLHMSQTLDTTKDIAINLVGGWVAWKWGRRFV